MLFNEQEMISLCNEMGIELIDNDKCTSFPIVDSSLFNLVTISDDKFTELNECEFVMDEMILLAS